MEAINSLVKSHGFGLHNLCTLECPTVKAKAKGGKYDQTNPYLCPEVHSDIKQDLKDTPDKCTHPNKAISSAAVTLAPKAINYIASATFADRVIMVQSRCSLDLKLNEYLIRAHKMKTKFREYHNRTETKKKRKKAMQTNIWNQG
eukprot:7553435-Ditylum_brightwellii.AAC.1